MKTITLRFILNIIITCYLISVFMGVPDRKERNVDLLKE